MAAGRGRWAALQAQNHKLGRWQRRTEHCRPQIWAVPLETDQRQVAGTATHRRSIRKVSSVAGSAKTMSGSFNI